MPKTEASQEIQVQIDVLVNVSTRYTDEELRALIERNALLVFKNNNRHFNGIRFREEAAIYSDVGGWVTIFRPPGQDFDSDPASVLAAAASLLEQGERNHDVSQAYQGCDGFMRRCQAVAEFFEGWANANVDWSRNGEVWPYMLRDKFGPAVAATVGILNLQHFGAGECERIARAMKAPLKRKPKTKKPHAR